LNLLEQHQSHYLKNYQKWFKFIWLYKSWKNSIFVTIIGNFALPSFNKKKTLLKFIRDTENNFKKIKPSNNLNIYELYHIDIEKLFIIFVQNNIISKRLTQLVRYTKQFCANNPDIIFTKANKASITMALNKNTYISKVKEMLDNPDQYQSYK